MCSSCRMDPSWEKIELQRQGAVEVEDFYKEVNYRPKTKKKSVKKYPGCPGNDKGPHIYVWTTEYNHATLFFDHFGFHKREQKICAGCGHRDKTRHTEEYSLRNSREKDKRRKNGQRVWKYWSFEDYDEEFRVKRDEHNRRHGWSEYTYGQWWW